MAGVPISPRIRMPASPSPVRQHQQPRVPKITQQGVRIYADNAATTMMRPEALDAYVSTCKEAFANPSSQYAVGRAAHDRLEWARGVFSKYMNVNPDTVYFTSCGTESNNIAIRSVLARMRKTTGRTIIVTSSVEHSSVRKTAELASGACNHIMAPVDPRGYIDEQKFREILMSNQRNIAMISIILAQNEVGTLQRIPILTRIAREVLGPYVPFHTDATQAFGKYVIQPDALGIDMMTASAHKFHGPRGVGILYAAANVLDPANIPMSGGGQERGCRSGTENVPAIIASAVALECMLGNQELHTQRKAQIRALRDLVAAIIVRNIPDVQVNGDPLRGMYNLISLSLPGGHAAEMVKKLDLEGIAVGSGSACNKGRPSESMMAMSKPLEVIQGTLRISLSEANTVEECQELAVSIIRAWRASKMR